MSNSYAENEFNYLKNKYTNSVQDEKPMVLEFEKEILNLVSKFMESGQSGGSAPYVCKAIVSAVEDLMMVKPLEGLTGDDFEWCDSCSSHYQNKRLGSVFKEKNDNKPYYLNAIIFKDKNGACWSGSALLKDGSKILSRQYIKSFPFRPKTFYIDVLSEELSKDNWVSYVKDETQLKEVFEYYDIFAKGE